MIKTSEELIEETLNEYLNLKIKEGKTKFIVLPMGDWGRLAKKILLQRGIDTFFCFDNLDYDMENIYPIDYLKKNEIKDAEILLMARSREVERQLQEQIKKNNFGKVSYSAYEEIKLPLLRELKREKCLKLDFLCVGFPKCATTSLHRFLAQNKYIELPKLKEPQFLCNISKNAHEAMFRLYEKENAEAVIRGAIEPSYNKYGQYVLEYFGEDIKLIFCVRNPVKALYSLFKHGIRDCTSDYVLDLYKKYEKPSMEMFKEFAENKRNEYCYVDDIEDWLKYYSKDNMIFLIAEEIFENPQKILVELQADLGLSGEQILSSNKFPHSNEGTSVAKDYISAYINSCVSHTIDDFHYNTSEDRLKIFRLRKTMNKLTTIEFNEKVPPELYSELLEYYMPSIKRLEEIMGRSLKGIWY